LFLIVFDVIDIAFIANLVVPFAEMFEYFMLVTGLAALAYAEYILYAYMGLMCLFGLLTVIFSIVTLARSGRKTTEHYYQKGGCLIGFVVVELILFLFYAGHEVLLYFAGASLTYSPLLLGVIGASLLVVVLRFIGIGRYFSGKKHRA
jgi:hypothetical protein